MADSASQMGIDAPLTYQRCDRLRGAAQDIMEGCATLVSIAVEGDKVQPSELAGLQQSAQGEIKRVALATQVLVKLAQEWMAQVYEEQYLQVDFLIHCSKRLRKSILTFVSSTKDCLSNTLDFLTREEQRRQSQNVLTHTQNVLGVVSLLEKQALEAAGHAPLSPGSSTSLTSLLQATNSLAGDSMVLVQWLQTFTNAIHLLEPLLEGKNCDAHLRQLKDNIVAVAKDVNDKVSKFGEQVIAADSSLEFREREFLSYQRMVEAARESLAEELISIVLKAQAQVSGLSKLTHTTHSGRLARANTCERLKEAVAAIESQRSASPVAQRRVDAKPATSSPLKPVTPREEKEREKEEKMQRKKIKREAKAKKEEERRRAKANLDLKPKKKLPRRNSNPNMSEEPSAPSLKSKFGRKTRQTGEAPAGIVRSNTPPAGSSYRTTMDVSELEKVTSKLAVHGLSRSSTSFDKPLSQPSSPRMAASGRAVPTDSASTPPAAAVPPVDLKAVQEPEEQAASSRVLTHRSASVAMEAAMAAAVPTFVEMFRMEFSWFEKYWKREGLTKQMTFSKDLKNQLVALMPSAGAEFQPSQPLQMPQRAASNLSSLTGHASATSKEEHDEKAIQHMLLGANMKWMRRESNQQQHEVDDSTVAELNSMATDLENESKSIQTLCANLLSQEAAEVLVEEQRLCEVVTTMLHSLQKVLFAVTTNTNMEHLIHQERDVFLSKASSISTVGIRDEVFMALVNQLNSELEVKTMVVGLKDTIGDMLDVLRSQAIQLIVTLRKVAEGDKIISNTTSLEVLAVSIALLDSTERLVNAMATYRSAKATALKQRDPASRKQLRIHLERQVQLEMGEDLWSAYEHLGPYEPDSGISVNEWVLYIVLPNRLEEEERTKCEVAFCSSSLSFASCSAVVRKMIAAYQPPDSFVEDDGEVRLAAGDLMLHWLAKNAHYLSNSCCEELGDFADWINDTHVTLAEGIRSAITATRASVDERWLQPMPVNEPLVAEEGTLKAMSALLLSTPAKAIAEQLTLIDMKLLARVKRKELLSQAWSREKLKPSAPNVVHILERLNQMSYWVPTAILLYDQVKQRAKVAQKFYEVAVELRKLNNFNSLMSLVAGLNNAAVSRLKYTLGVVHCDLFEEFEKLEAIMSPQKNYSVYRTTIEQEDMPLIPFMGIYLTDLTFIDENPDMLDDKVNYNKRLLISNCFENIERFQSTCSQYSDRLQEEKPLSIYLHHLPCFGSDLLFKLSLDREPRKAEIQDIL